MGGNVIQFPERESDEPDDVSDRPTFPERALIYADELSDLATTLRGLEKLDVVSKVAFAPAIGATMPIKDKNGLHIGNAIKIDVESWGFYVCMSMECVV